MSATRLNLPQAFIDAVSQVGLQQPIPMFAMARMLFSSVAAAQLAQGLPNGVPSSSALEQNMLMLDPIRQPLVKVFDELMGVGHVDDTVKITRPSYSGGGYTTASRVARAEASTSIVPISISGETASITLQMYEGPYDTTNSRVAPIAYAPHQINGRPDFFGREVFDQLNYDRWAFVDGVLMALCEINATHIVAGDPTAALNGTVMATVANNAFLSAGDRPFDCDTIMRGKVVLMDAKVRPLPNGKYAAFLSTKQQLDITRDPDWKNASKEKPESNIIGGSWIGEIHGVELYALNTIGTASNSSSVTYQKGFMLGDGALGYAPGEPCKVVPSHDTNYDKQFKFVWQSVDGFVRLDNRMGVSLLSD